MYHVFEDPDRRSSTLPTLTYNTTPSALYVDSKYMKQQDKTVTEMKGPITFFFFFFFCKISRISLDSHILF